MGQSIQFLIEVYETLLPILVENALQIVILILLNKYCASYSLRLVCIFEIGPVILYTINKKTTFIEIMCAIRLHFITVSPFILILFAANHTLLLTSTKNVSFLRSTSSSECSFIDFWHLPVSAIEIMCSILVSMAIFCVR